MENVGAKNFSPLHRVNNYLALGVNSTLFISLKSPMSFRAFSPVIQSVNFFASSFWALGHRAVGMEITLY